MSRRDCVVWRLEETRRSPPFLLSSHTARLSSAPPSSSHVPETLHCPRPFSHARLPSLLFQPLPPSLSPPSFSSSAPHTRKKDLLHIQPLGLLSPLLAGHRRRHELGHGAVGECGFSSHGPGAIVFLGRGELMIGPVRSSVCLK